MGWFRRREPKPGNRAKSQELIDRAQRLAAESGRSLNELVGGWVEDQQKAQAQAEEMAARLGVPVAEVWAEQISMEFDLLEETWGRDILTMQKQTIYLGMAATQADFPGVARAARKLMDDLKAEDEEGMEDSHRELGRAVAALRTVHLPE